MARQWLGWHFADASEKLRYGDGRKIKVGRTHKVKVEPIMCQQGLHASKHVLDALNYAPGCILYRVSLGGKIVHGDDKSVANERTYLARINVDQILLKFARRCALDVVHLWDCPRIVRDYLETGDVSLRAAARAAPEAAARAAARAAAEAAARAAAEAAARAAAEAAARAAAEAAARAAARAAQKKLLDKMILAELRKQAKKRRSKSKG